MRTSQFGGAHTSWSPYSPSKEAPWDLRRVVHLHRRVGFGATRDELRRDLHDGPEPSVERLLSGTSRLAISADFEDRAGRLADAAEKEPLPGRLKAWWVLRMLESPDPLGERLTLMWHDHFATSNLKVDDLSAMHRQNELFRQHARGSFGKLLNAVVRDPALLLWLDAPENRMARSNENLARELLELFTLGVGHYSERDVKEAARALTGLTIRQGTSRLDATLHDDGEKTILGRSARVGVDDLLRLLLDHPATAERVAWRIGSLLMGEEAVTAAMHSDLAAGLRQRELDIGWAVGTVVRSEAFFGASNLGAKVLDPAGMVVGPARALGLSMGRVDPSVLAAWMAAMGQDLFYPPNVAGWAGGRAWLSTRAVIARANYATWAAIGTAWDTRGPAVLDGHDDPLAFASELLIGMPPRPEWRSRFADPRRDVAPEAEVRRAVALVLGSPLFQLG
jgi:uncharacterized protein (DUF1800 family)